MIAVRLIPVYLSLLMFAAHVLRFYGLYPALLVLLLAVTLTIRRHWIPVIWQVLLGFAALAWIKITIDLVQFRIAMHMDWMRLAIIMGAVVTLTIFSAFLMRTRKITDFYQLK